MIKYRVKDNGSKGMLVGIEKSNSKWFMAKELTTADAELIVMLLNKHEEEKDANA